MACSKLKCMKIYLSASPTKDIDKIKELSNQLRECLECISNCQWSCFIQKRTINKLEEVLSKSRQKYLTEN